MAGWQDAFYMMNDMATSSGVYPWAMTSNWGGGAQVTVNSDQNIWQAQQMQAIHYGAHYGFPTATLPILPGGDCNSFINAGMLGTVAQRAGTTLTTIASIKKNLNNELTKEGATEEYKAALREQLEKLEAVEAKIKEFQTKIQKQGGDWQQREAELEALLGEKAEIDEAIKTLLEEEGEVEESEEVTDADSDNDTDIDSDDDNDTAAQRAAMSAQAATKAEAEANLTTVYGDNKPASVTVNDQGKFERKVTVDGEEVTKTYDTLQQLEDETKTMKASSKEEAEENIKIVYGGPQEGLTATEDGKFKFDEIEGEYETLAELETAIRAAVAEQNGDADAGDDAVLGAGSVEMTEEQEAAFNAKATDGDAAMANLKAVYDDPIPPYIVAYTDGKIGLKQNVAEGQTAKVQKFDSIKELNEAIAFTMQIYGPMDEAYWGNVENISKKFDDAIDTIWGTNEEKLLQAMSALNGNNVIEVMNTFEGVNSEYHNIRGVVGADGMGMSDDSFTEAFLDDADDDETATMGNYLYNALLERAQRYIDIQGTPATGGAKISDCSQYTLTGGADDQEKQVVSAFNELLKELNSGDPKNSTVLKHVNTIREYIEAQDRLYEDIALIIKSHPTTEQA